jgi:hypothetical protein
MDNLIEEEFYIKPLLTPEGHLALGYLLAAWLAFRDAHVIENFEADQATKTLFEALTKYEALMMGKKVKEYKSTRVKG